MDLHMGKEPVKNRRGYCDYSYHYHYHCSRMSVRPEGVLGQGGAMYPTVGQFQYAALNPQREIPKDHFIWSLLCFHYFNPFCLGLAALIHSVKARDKKVMGDIEAANNYASTARTLNIISTVLYILFVISLIIALAVLLSQRPK